jgi:hypothetical protein
MKDRIQWLIVAAISVFIMAGGILEAFPLHRAVASVPAPAAVPSLFSSHEGAVRAQGVVGETITYQGRLTDPQGDPLDGSYPMQFILYDAESGGTAVWDSGQFNVEVTEGLFTVDLSVDQTDFDGQALWLEISVDGQILSPRQAIRPAPYALGLRPGARVVGEPPDFAGSVFGADVEGTYPLASAIQGTAATGDAIHGDSDGGYGLRGYSASGNALSASSDAKTAGVFQSNEGYGIRVNTDGSDHWDHAGYFTSNLGYGVYAVSSQNDGVRGEGDIAGVRGTGDVIGTYGFSSANFGLYGGTSSGFGVYGYTASSTNNYGIYTPDNLYAQNVTMSGALTQIAQNGSDQPLEPGDVVVFSGVDTSSGDAPVVQVATTTFLNSSSVAGVVHGRHNMDAAREIEASPGAAMNGNVGAEEITPPGPVPPGGYMLIVVHGVTQVKAEALSTEIAPGDLLATGTTSGHATRATQYEVDGLSTTSPGTVFAKALEPVEAGRDLIYVYVTLQ